MVDLALVWRNVPEKDICTELAKEYNQSVFSDGLLVVAFLYL